jgi:hypothetical protein
MSHLTGMGSGIHDLPEYWRDIYGDATIGWVPPVTNYNYTDNIPFRGINNRTFTWGEVSITLEDVQENALIDFIMPDSYMIEMTPDIGWSNVLSMFGEDQGLGLNNPHLVSLGPFYITNGTLTDNGTSVTATLTEAQFDKALIKGQKNYLWRAVPWADGNPGLGGAPTKFTNVSEDTQTNFSIDEIIKETRRPVQYISGKKGSKVTVSVTDVNNPETFIEQTDASWRIYFTIDRPRVKFTVKALDSGGSAVAYHQVDIEYSSFEQFDQHIWNTFDSFSLMAGVDRLPHESNAMLKGRITDAFSNRGGSHYNGLISGVNRELGLSRIEDAIVLERALNGLDYSRDPSVEVEVTHISIQIRTGNFLISDEFKKIDPYFNTVTTEKRIANIVMITNAQGIELSDLNYHITDDVDHNEIRFKEKISGAVAITYDYIEELKFSDCPLVGDMVNALRVLNSKGTSIFKVTTSSKISGSERSCKLFKGSTILDAVSPTSDIGWSDVNLSAIANRLYKESFKDESSLYFNTKYYQYILELKSNTNIEWGHLVADKDVWDAVDNGTYGTDSLEAACDISLAGFSTPVPVPRIRGRKEFDPWEAFRMGYYYEGALIKNTGFPKQAFRSGVGFIKDCAVTVGITNISANDNTVNQNPVVTNPKDVFDIDESAVSDIIVRI